MNSIWVFVFYYQDGIHLAIPLCEMDCHNFNLNILVEMQKTCGLDSAINKKE